LHKDNEYLRKYIINKYDEFSKMQSLNESLIKEVNNLKKENNSKIKLETNESRGELKKNGRNQKVMQA